MTRFVLDASVSLAWCLEDEKDPDALRVLDLLEDGEAVVPEFWALEVANSLLVGERRGRLSAAETTTARELLRRLSIHEEPVPASEALTTILELARQTGLSSYDAAYLHLCLRLDLPLATVDNRQSGAAVGLGIRRV